MSDSISNLGDKLPDLPPPPPEMTGEALREFGDKYARRRVREERAACWRRNCPTDFLETSFADPRLAHNAPQLAKVLGWQYGPRGLLLAGPTGNGKTRALWALVGRLVCDEGRDFRFWKVQKLVARITGTMHYGSDDAQDIIDGLASMPVLVIDDLGQEATTDAQEERARSWLLYLLDRRLELGLPLLATTNCTAEQLAGTEGGKSAVRADPLMRRLLDLAEPVRFSAAPTPPS